MEEDLRLLRYRNSPPLSSDPQPLSELICSSSNSSTVTVDNTSEDCSNHCAPSPFSEQSTRWTEQQHNLYLSSLESSFVKELHRYMHLHGQNLQNKAKETYKCITFQNSNVPRQSLDVQDGHQKKINLERIAPMLESTEVIDQNFNDEN